MEGVILQFCRFPTSVSDVVVYSDASQIFARGIVSLSKPRCNDRSCDKVSLCGTRWFIEDETKNKECNDVTN